MEDGHSRYVIWRNLRGAWWKKRWSNVLLWHNLIPTWNRHALLLVFVAAFEKSYFIMLSVPVFSRRLCCCCEWKALVSLTEATAISEFCLVFPPIDLHWWSSNGLISPAHGPAPCRLNWQSNCIQKIRRNVTHGVSTRLWHKLILRHSSWENYMLTPDP